MVEAKAAAMEREAEVLEALAHPLRLLLLEALREGEECVCHLSTLLDKPQPYISKQLAELRQAGLVVDRRDGRRVYYRLTDERLRPLLDAVRALTGRAPLVGRRSLDGCPCPRCSSQPQHLDERTAVAYGVSGP